MSKDQHSNLRRNLSAHLNRLSIERKLAGLMVGIGIGCVLLTGLGLLLFELPATKRRMAEEHNSIAAVAAAGLAPATYFEDPDGALEALQVIFADPQVLRAWVLDTDGKICVSHPAHTSKITPPPGPNVVASPIQFEDQDLGTVVIEIGNDALEAYTNRILMISMGVALMAMILTRYGVLLARKTITQPLMHLIEVVQAAGQAGDYSNRVEVRSMDELGSLTDSFNRMMEQVQLRDATLVAAREDAEEATRAKASFLANMSHEIRTPMNGVLGMAQVLQGMQLNEEQRNAADTIVGSAEALLVVINDILDLSKLDAEGVALSPEPHNIVEGVAAVTALLGRSAKKANINLHTEIASDLPKYLSLDVGRLRQVLLNIVGNAIKFTKEGSVTIRVGGQEIKTGSWALEIAVIDTGIGIPANKLSDVFEAFAQADGSTTRRFGGTGLGLAISRRLVHAMGGSIDIESELNLGSTFSIRLDLPISAPPSQLDHTETQKVFDGDWRVLLVEDNKINRLVASRILEQLGISVSIAEHGGQVMEGMELNHIDLVLMDCQMPVLDGFEATRLVRKDERFAHVPIIALTAHSMAGYKELCIERGMDDYLTKPFKRAALAELLVTWLGQESRSQAA